MCLTAPKLQFLHQRKGPQCKPRRQGAERWQQVKNFISEMKRIIVYGLFIIMTAILLLDSFSSFEITSSIILFLVRLMTFATFSIILFGFCIKVKGDELILYSILTIGFLFIITFPFSWNPAWNPQTIMYQNLHLANRTIEYQMQDFGVFGSKSRIVDRMKFLPYFYWTKEININNIDTLTWEKVDIAVN